MGVFMICCKGCSMTSNDPPPLLDAAAVSDGVDEGRGPFPPVLLMTLEYIDCLELVGFAMLPELPGAL
jgi:hypothetical protein